MYEQFMISSYHSFVENTNLYYTGVSSGIMAEEDLPVVNQHLLRTRPDSSE